MYLRRYWSCDWQQGPDVAMLCYDEVRLRSTQYRHQSTNSLSNRVKLWIGHQDINQSSAHLGEILVNVI